MKTFFFTNMLKLTTCTLISFFIFAQLASQPGQLDNSFGQNGLVVMDVSEPGDCQLWCSALQNDGKIITAGHTTGFFGQTFYLSRHLPNGSLDNTFGIGGITYLKYPYTGSFHTLSIQENGKIIAAGSLIVGGFTDFFLVRFNYDGSMDSTFGSEGTATITLDGISDEIESVVIQTDGKIIAGGYTDFSGNHDFALARFDTNGVLDPTFSGDGIVVTGAAGEERIFSLCLQNDGKILAGGCSDALGTDDFVIARYTTEGSLDATFSSDGIVALGSSWRENVKSLMVQDDGKIVAVGSSHNSTSGKSVFSLLRLTAEGLLDTDFGTGGIDTTEIGEEAVANSALLQPDGKIVVAGYSALTAGNNVITLARFNSDGSRDEDFGSNGIVLNEVGSISLAMKVLETNEEEIIVACNSVKDGGDKQISLVQYTFAGVPDVEFGEEGIFNTPITASISMIEAVARQSDGKIISAGYYFSGTDVNGFIIRNNSDGTIDETFNSVLMDGSSNTYLKDIAIVTSEGIDQKIIIVGSDDISGNFGFLVICLNMDGSFDPTFDGDGIINRTIGIGDCRATTVTIKDGNTILVGGSSNSGTSADFTVVAFDLSGELDNSFDTDGFVTTDLGGEDYIGSMLIQPDGKIVAAGFSGYGPYEDCAMVRYNNNGSLDENFDDNGILVNSISIDEDRISDIAIQQDGKLVTACYYSNGDNDDFAIFRYNANGTPDLSFGSEGLAIYDYGDNSNDWARSVLIQNDGRIILIGYNYGSLLAFKAASSDKSSIIVLGYNDIGIPDLSFVNGGEAIFSFTNASTILCSAIQDNEKIVIGTTLTNNGNDYNPALFRVLTIQEETSINTSQKPLEVHTLEIFPNPFSTSTIIRFNVEYYGYVSLKIHDISGKEIATLADENFEPGTYIINYKGFDLKQGVYICLLRTAIFSETKRFAVLR